MMPRSKVLVLVLSAAFALAVASCATDAGPTENTGSLNLNLQLVDGSTIDEVAWTISGGDMEPMTGTIDTSAPGATASVEVFGLPPGDDYLVELEATDESGELRCRGDAEFDVEVGVATDVMVFLNCKRPTRLGAVRVNGSFNICAQLAKVVVSPLQTSVGNDIDLSAQGEDVEGDAISYSWTASGGSIADPSAPETTYTCDATGEQLITITVSDDGGVYCMDDWAVSVNCVEGDGGTGGSGGAGGQAGAGGAGGEAGAGGAGGEAGAGGEGGTGGAVDPCEGVTCDDTGNECTAAECNPSSGQCETSNVADGTPCADDTGTCNAGECVPNPECVVDADCPDTGNECIDAVCNAGSCETANNTDPCDGGAGTCNAGVCEPNAEVVYSQDFNMLDIAASDALAADGWLVFGSVFDSAGNFLFPYGPFVAPNGGQGFSALVDDQGGPEQQPQQLSIYSDYGCCQPSSGHFAGTDLVESSVFQEPYPNRPGEQIPAGDIGKTFTFSFDAKRGNINSPTDPKCVSGGPEESANPPCDSEALAYIQTLQPPSFARTNYIVLDMTNLPAEWGRYEISLDLTDPALEGQVLQFGFRTITNAFEPSGNFYDNVLATLTPAAP